ncbi:MAG: 3-oxoacyl-ACP reductase family protein [Candidatus Omnitrophota bacterium]
MSLKEKVFIVTGGTRGIGRGIVEELASGGAKVAFTYMAQDRLAKELVETLKGSGKEAISFKADVRDYGKAKEVAAKTMEHFGRLDGLVNNAGILRDKPLMMMEPGDWEEVIATNLFGAFNFCRAVIVPLMKQKSGDIVNVASTAGMVGRPGQTNYAASKAGMIGLTKALAREVARYHIRVNAVAPGFIETDMTRTLNEKIKTELLKDIPMGRFGEVKEVAKLTAFLLSGDRYITGQVFCMAGGMVMA